jgi:cellulose synthase (UDP-forming)
VPDAIPRAGKSASAQPYFVPFLNRRPPKVRSMTHWERTSWQILAATTIGLGAWYLNWRWTTSLNTDAIVFSVAVALAESLTFLGTLLFFFDIWDEDDTPPQPAPSYRAEIGLSSGTTIHVDIFITTFDEDTSIILPSIQAAKSVIAPPGVATKIYLLDDGNRPLMRDCAEAAGVHYIAREDNRGFKAGNLANALFASEGDFFVICDADTQLFPSFLQNTLGYFRDPRVSWVQTPHWFYDIPDGILWTNWACKTFGKNFSWLGALIAAVTGNPKRDVDPYLSDPVLFFDVIQRRRNRNTASFCCGAGSIHRREAVFQNALAEQGKALSGWTRKTRNAAAFLLPRLDFQPFRFHVSEDIFTSILHQSRGWRSVYHPTVEARMLSPWSSEAWAMQKLKSAGGTFDIMLRANPMFSRGMPWRIKLHYLATFWSYLSILWLPILLFAPAFSLVTGIAPVEAYSVPFFLHLLPVLIANEVALQVGCKGHNLHAGRMLSIGVMHIQWRALIQVLQGMKPHFAPTPKTPGKTRELRHLRANIAILVVFIGAMVWALTQYQQGNPDYSVTFLVVNLFWLVWNAASIIRVLKIALWRPSNAHGFQAQRRPS